MTSVYYNMDNVLLQFIQKEERYKKEKEKCKIIWIINYYYRVGGSTNYVFPYLNIYKN